MVVDGRRLGLLALRARHRDVRHLRYRLLRPVLFRLKGDQIVSIAFMGWVYIINPVCEYEVKTSVSEYVVKVREHPSKLRHSNRFSNDHKKEKIAGETFSTDMEGG